MRQKRSLTALAIWSALGAPLDGRSDSAAITATHGVAEACGVPKSDPKKKKNNQKSKKKSVLIWTRVFGAEFLVEFCNYAINILTLIAFLSQLVDFTLEASVFFFFGKFDIFIFLLQIIV